MNIFSKIYERVFKTKEATIYSAPYLGVQAGTQLQPLYSPFKEKVKGSKVKFDSYTYNLALFGYLPFSYFLDAQEYKDHPLMGTGFGATGIYGLSDGLVSFELGPYYSFGGNETVQEGFSVDKMFLKLRILVNSVTENLTTKEKIKSDVIKHLDHVRHEIAKDLGIKILDTIKSLFPSTSFNEHDDKAPVDTSTAHVVIFGPKSKIQLAEKISDSIDAHAQDGYTKDNRLKDEQVDQNLIKAALKDAKEIKIDEKNNKVKGYFDTTKFDSTLDALPDDQQTKFVNGIKEKILDFYLLKVEIKTLLDLIGNAKDEDVADKTLGATFFKDKMIAKLYEDDDTFLFLRSLKTLNMSAWTATMVFYFIPGIAFNLNVSNIKFSGEVAFVDSTPDFRVGVAVYELSAEAQ